MEAPRSNPSRRVTRATELARRRRRVAGRFLALLLPALLFSGALTSALLGAPDEALRKRIDEAVARGREIVLDVLPGLVGKPPGDYPMGRIALPLAAALKAGASASDPRVVAAFEKLRQLPMRKTYSVACYLFALDGLARARERDAFERPSSRTVVAGSRGRDDLWRRIAAAVDWLVEARAEGRGYWSYDPQPPGSGAHDYSNTQFAVLGLQIGLEYKVPIPREVFEEIARRFIETQTPAGEKRVVAITRAATLESALEKRLKPTGRTRVVRPGEVGAERFRVAPGGWGYHGKSNPYASMTGSGASSLTVALAGLGGRSDRLSLEAKKALYGGYAWIGEHFKDYPEGNRHYYYTLYSLEKVGDLGEIETFDGHDWYVEGARALIAREKPKGGWGSYPDTSFALFFLTRATRLAPAEPVITTRSGEEAGAGPNRDLVYVDRVGGFISARQFFQHFSRTRRRTLLPVAEEIVENYAPGARGELVPLLVSLWTKRGDDISRFARRALAEITHLRSRDRGAYAKWAEEYLRIRELEAREGVKDSEVAELLAELRNPALKSLLLDVAQRRGHRGIVAAVIRDLAVEDPAYRRKAHGLLELWTGHSRPAPADDDEAGWRRAATEWAEWWRVHRVEVEGKQRARKLVVTLLAASRDPKATAGVVDALRRELVSLGEPARAAIREALSSDDFPFALVEALEALDGRPIGLTAR